MKKLIFKRNNCRLCSNHNLKLVLKFAPTPIGENYVSAEQINKIQNIYPLDVFFCNNCNHVQLLNVINPNVLHGGYIYDSSFTKGLINHLKEYSEEILILTNSENLFVINIGSNDGTLLKFFKEKGMKVLGFEPEKDVKIKSGIDTIPLSFTYEIAVNIKKERGSADVIICGAAHNTFANIDNLYDILKGVSYLLSPKGIFVFEVGYLVDIIQKTLFNNIYHEHLSYHSVKSLKTFFHSHDMELIDVKRLPFRGGSLRGIVQLKNGLRKVSLSVIDLINIEERIGIPSIETFNKFSSKIHNLKNQLNNLLIDLKAKGKTIIGYGASVGTTTILYQFDLRDLNFIVDDNPIKHNLYSPGFHIPIFSPEKIYKENPDYILILAPQYAKQIINKHKKYLDQGGNFILFLPQLRIINKYNYGCELK